MVNLSWDLTVRLASRLSGGGSGNSYDRILCTESQVLNLANNMSAKSQIALSLG